MTKCLPFNSKYLQDFQVVEQREGNFRRFPHTDQLRRLLRALTYEFELGLPAKIARVNEHASGYMKMQRHTAALMFCSHINSARKDELRLRAVVDRNLVARISIVQQSVEHVGPAPIHRFKFYAGDDFFVDIYLNGKKIAFAKHALERFSERVPNHIGTDLTNLFDSFFGSPAVVMECDKSPAFVYPYEESLIAFPVRLSDTEPEYFLPTCLTGKEINQLKPILPPPAYCPCYDSVYREPKVRNWDPILLVLALQKLWKLNLPFKTPELTVLEKLSWSEIGHRIIDVLKEQGHGEGSRLVFQDNIPGHSIIRLRPGQEEQRHVEVEDLKRLDPKVDWEKLVIDQKAANPHWYGSSQISGQP